MGEKIKKKINMEWRGSQHAVSAEGLGEGAVCHPPGMRQGTPRGSPGPGRPLDLRHQHGTLCATSMALSFTLLKTWVVDLVLKEGEEGKTKRIRVRTNGPGRAALVQSKRPSGWRWLRWAAALTSHGMPARRVLALRAEAGRGWSGVEVSQTMCCY